MKNIFLKIILMLLFSNTYSQILPVEDLKYYRYSTSEEKRSLDTDGITYVKDVNNKLSKFVGAWKGEVLGTEYTFKIEKFLRVSENTGIKFDKLIMRYRVATKDGVVKDIFNLGTENYLAIKGSELAEDNVYVFYYLGEESLCGQRGYFHVISIDSNTIELVFTPNYHMIDNHSCPELAKQIFPKNIRATRQ